MAVRGFDLNIWLLVAVDWYRSQRVFEETKLGEIGSTASEKPSQV
jgi:hypothetical protein